MSLFCGDIKLNGGVLPVGDSSLRSDNNNRGGKSSSQNGSSFIQQQLSDEVMKCTESPPH